MKWVREVTGIGKVYAIRQANPKWKPGYCWAVQGMQDTWDFLNLIKPYCKIKAGKVELGIVLLKIRLEKEWGATITDLELLLAQALHKSNKRGTEV